MELSKLARVAAAAALLLTAAPAISYAADPLGVDDGTQLTLWTRAATQARADQLIQAYNASHKNHVTATYVPTDDYQTKVGAAAAANGLPDLFSADVVFMPNWTSAGLFTDVTDRIDNMPGIDKVAQAGINVGAWDGKKYGMPFVADLSVWMWNKKLFKQAGLDPERGRRRSTSSPPMPAPWPSLVAISRAPCGAAIAAAARSSPGSRSPGPTAPTS